MPGNNLFGVDIAGLINQHVSVGVLDLTLRRFTNQPRGDILDAPISVPTNYSGKGFIEMFANDLDSVNGNQIQEGDRQIILIGNSIEGGAIPKRHDEVDIEGDTYKVLSLIDRDPDKATYTVHARL